MKILLARHALPGMNRDPRRRPISATAADILL
jgi:hypothetical protein